MSLSSLSDIEIRILGTLVEKERTTPESYPLTTNSLVLACNQKSNRNPVTSYIQQEIETTLRLLQDKGLTNTTREANERAFKHTHKLVEAYHINPKELAILAVLMLRGLQTVGELRSRTERYIKFNDLAEVDVTLLQLAEQHPPMVRNYGRGSGQSQDRWGHLLGLDPEKQKPRARANSLSTETLTATVREPVKVGEVTSGGQEDVQSEKSELKELKLEIRQLKTQLDQINKYLELLLQHNNIK